MKLIHFFMLFLWITISFSQSKNPSIITKIITLKNNTLVVDNVSINPCCLKLLDSLDNEISNTKYDVNFSTATIVFKNNDLENKEITVQYKPLPEFLTKTYTIFDENLIIDNSRQKKLKFYELNDSENKPVAPIFNGLETTGYLARGITVGNNQDGVVNSGLELQLKGKLSRKVSINATISDNTIPLQNNGYTQRLNEYDRIYVELFSDKWKLTGGDLFLNNSDSRYLTFNKKVAGLQVETNLISKKAKIDLAVSGALVEGKFTNASFQGQEANQGPYRLANTINQFLLIITNSETVYINGIELSKENYTLDYSSAEITFSTTFPVNSDMRILVEFQASEQNYVRFVSYNKAKFEQDNFKVEVDFYSENDSKNKSLQQDLSDLQKGVLSSAGDDTAQMYGLSAVNEAFNEGRIQYKKELIGGNDVFVYSNNSTDELYSVKFTYLGNNQGNYSIDNTIATGNIFVYVSDLNGVKQGDYEPKIQLNAPSQLQITTLRTSFDNSSTIIHSDFAFSDNDKNLFSSINDNDNQGVAGMLTWNQAWIDKKWKLSSNLSYEHINRKFVSVQRITAVEFNRAWNINEYIANQNLFKVNFNYLNDEKGFIKYQFENLNFQSSFNGVKHHINSALKFNKTTALFDASLMSSESAIEDSNFSQLYTDVKHQFSDFLIGFKTDLEQNLRKNTQQQLTNLSFKNQGYSAYFSVKDSLRTKIELGYSYRTNDSIQNAELQNVNKSNSYYLKSDIFKKKDVDLSIFINYRHFTNSFFNKEKSLNSKINYRQQFADNFFQFNSVYETSSGTIPQQEFNYLEVDSGKGFYAWFDYNNDGVQDLDEFEIAKFQDEAIYVRVLLPSTKFIRTNQTKLSNLLTINPSKWNTSKNKTKKVFSHFINQTNISIDNKQIKVSNFQFNPFDTNNALALQFNIKNYLFFNRGKQHYSTTYTYLKSDNNTVFVTGQQKNNIESNQLQFSHKINKTWLIDLKGASMKTTNVNERFASRNMNLNTNLLNGELSYLFNDSDSSFRMSYSLNDKQNNSVNNEALQSSKLGLGLQHISSKKFSFNSSISYIMNSYNGNQNTPIAYQLMEGLQNGKNYTWNLILQKSLTNYLSINLNYNGRKSESFKSIHTGNVQLRANF